MRALYFDMDGTIADLYGVANWLDMILHEEAAPYEAAATLIDGAALASELEKLQRAGWHIGIVSWTAKNGTTSYNRKVKEAKEEWLTNHIPNFHWDEIVITEYGTPKNTVVNYPNGLLFDDEERNRNDWEGIAYNVENILEVIRGL